MSRPAKSSEPTFGVWRVSSVASTSTAIEHRRDDKPAAVDDSFCVENRIWVYNCRLPMKCSVKKEKCAWGPKNSNTIALPLHTTQRGYGRVGQASRRDPPRA